MIRTVAAFVRSTIFYIGYVLVSLGMSLLFLLINPFLTYRSRYRFSAAWCRFVIWWLRISCGVRHRVHGAQRLGAGPLLVLANHQSTWETLYLFQLMYPVAPILKRELLDIPFWGSCLAKLHPIAIDRSRPREAGRSLLIQGCQRLADGHSIYIFPEGTRSSDGTVKRFSKGGARLACASGARVVPAALDTGKCWPARRFLKFPGTINVEFGEALDGADFDAAVLSERVEDWIRQRIESPGWQ